MNTTTQTARLSTTPTDLATSADTPDTLWHLNLEDLGNHARVRMDKAENYRVSAGIYLVEARERIRNTKGVTWKSFLEEHGISRSKAGEVLLIAAGKTTMAELPEKKTASRGQPPKTSALCGHSETLLVEPSVDDLCTLLSALDKKDPGFRRALANALVRRCGVFAVALASSISHSNSELIIERKQAQKDVK